MRNKNIFLTAVFAASLACVTACGKQQGGATGGTSGGTSGQQQPVAPGAGGTAREQQGQQQRTPGAGKAPQPQHRAEGAKKRQQGTGDTGGATGGAGPSQGRQLQQGTTEPYGTQQYQGDGTGGAVIPPQKQHEQGGCTGGSTGTTQQNVTPGTGPATQAPQSTGTAPGAAGAARQQQPGGVSGGATGGAGGTAEETKRMRDEQVYPVVRLGAGYGYLFDPWNADDIHNMPGTSINRGGESYGIQALLGRMPYLPGVYWGLEANVMRLYHYNAFSFRESDADLLSVPVLVLWEYPFGKKKNFTPFLQWGLGAEFTSGDAKALVIREKDDRTDFAAAVGPGFSVNLGDNLSLATVLKYNYFFTEHPQKTSLLNLSVYLGFNI